MKSVLIRVFGRCRLLWSVLLAALLLSGCVKYDVGVNVDHPNHGEIVQHISIAERLTSFSRNSAEEWLNSIERRTRQLEGRVRRVSNQELFVTIPFNNAAELEAKFNEFFNPGGQKNSQLVTNTATELPKIESNLHLAESNLLLLQRNRLSYDLDLRSLSLISTNSNLIINPGSILELEFSLNTPWGARSIKKDDAISPQGKQNGRHLVWILQPGQVNHIEAVFWLPSPLGIGTVLIILFIAGGIYLRYNFMPDPATMQATAPVVTPTQPL